MGLPRRAFPRSNSSAIWAGTRDKLLFLFWSSKVSVVWWFNHCFVTFLPIAPFAAMRSQFFSMVDHFTVVPRARATEWLPKYLGSTRYNSPEQRRKNVHYHHRKKFWRTFLASKKTLHAGGRYKNPIKTRKPYLPWTSFLCAPHFFCHKKVPHRSRVVYSFFFQPEMIFLVFPAVRVNCLFRFTGQTPQKETFNHSVFKNLLMPLFLMGCFPVDFQEAKRPLRTKSVKRPIKVGKRPIKKGNSPLRPWCWLAFQSAA